MKTANHTTISFGEPVTVPALVPVEHKSTPQCIGAPFMVDGACYPVTALSFGTPHGAVFVEDIKSVDVPSLGVSLGTHPLFPQGASIVFIQMLDGENLSARVWQRGLGETAFTPEAACVAGTAAMMLHKVMSRSANVHMGGKVCQVQWDRWGEATLTGPSGCFPAMDLAEPMRHSGSSSRLG